MEDVLKSLQDCSLLVTSHISKVRLETINKESYSLVERRRRLVASEKLKAKLEKLVYENRSSINQPQMGALLDVYSDLLALVRALRTCVDRNSSDAAYHLDKIRDITDLRHSNAYVIASQEQEAKTQGIPHYFQG